VTSSGSFILYIRYCAVECCECFITDTLFVLRQKKVHQQPPQLLSISTSTASQNASPRASTQQPYVKVANFTGLYRHTTSTLLRSFFVDRSSLLHPGRWSRSLSKHPLLRGKRHRMVRSRSRDRMGSMGRCVSNPSGSEAGRAEPPSPHPRTEQRFDEGSQ